CLFQREGDKLTITVPGEGHDLAVEGGRRNAPRLLRGAEGDFAVQVRVGGDFRRKELAGDAGLPRGALPPRGRGGACRPASGGAGFVRLERCAGVGDLHLPGGAVVRYSACIGLPGRMTFMSGPSLGKPAYLRLERRGEVLTWAFSETGKAWWSHDFCKQATLR